MQHYATAKNLLLEIHIQIQRDVPGDELLRVRKSKVVVCRVVGVFLTAGNQQQRANDDKSSA